VVLGGCLFLAVVGGFAAGQSDPLTVGGRGLPFIAALADSATFVAGQPGQVLYASGKHLAAVHRSQSPRRASQ
jgi:hypothetical protein